VNQVAIDQPSYSGYRVAVSPHSQRSPGPHPGLGAH
jgi:hypothetical protein